LTQIKATRAEKMIFALIFKKNAIFSR
jgi:hypothetical protein